MRHIQQCSTVQQRELLPQVKEFMGGSAIIIIIIIISSLLLSLICYACITFTIILDYHKIFDINQLSFMPIKVV